MAVAWMHVPLMEYGSMKVKCQRGTEILVKKQRPWWIMWVLLSQGLPHQSLKKILFFHINAELSFMCFMYLPSQITLMCIWICINTQSCWSPIDLINTFKEKILKQNSYSINRQWYPWCIMHLLIKQFSNHIKQGQVLPKLMDLTLGLPIIKAIVGRWHIQN